MSREAVNPDPEYDGDEGYPSEPQNPRLDDLERRIVALERQLAADKPAVREDDPATPLHDEATGDFRFPGQL